MSELMVISIYLLTDKVYVSSISRGGVIKAEYVVVAKTFALLAAFHK